MWENTKYFLSRITEQQIEDEKQAVVAWLNL